MVPQTRSPRRPCDFWEPTSLAAIPRFFVVGTVVRTAPKRLAGQSSSFVCLLVSYMPLARVSRARQSRIDALLDAQAVISGATAQTNASRRREQPWRAAEAEDAAAAGEEAEAGAAGHASSAPSPRTTQIENAVQCARTPAARQARPRRRCRLRSQMKKTTTNPRSSRRRRASASIPNSGPAARARS